MKKVLLLAPMPSVHERFNIANMEVLTQLGCELHVASNFHIDAHAQEYARQLESNHVSVHDFSFERSSLKKNLTLIPAIKALLRKEQYDMVHCHTETGGILTRMAMGACKQTSFVYTPHGMSFYKGSSLKSQLVYRPIEKWICGKMSANLAINAEEYQVLQSWNSATAALVHGIGVKIADYQNVPVDRAKKRAELGIPADAFVLLSVGELNENKNHRIVLEALKQIADKPSELYYIICGEGPLRSVLMEQAQAAGMKERFLLPGFRYDIAEIFPIADLFVFPSFHEGLPVSLMQAMAVGLPVVCSQIRGNTDLIDNGQGGFCCQPDDAEGFARAIRMALKDASVRQSMGRANQEKVMLFDRSHVESEIGHVYRRILKL